MTWEPCTCTETHPSLTEEAVLNPDALPPSLRGWRRYRIEYGFECACPEGLMYLPASVDPDDIEKLINSTRNPRATCGE